jgi:hypothetical protein
VAAASWRKYFSAKAILAELPAAAQAGGGWWRYRGGGGENGYWHLTGYGQLASSRKRRKLSWPGYSAILQLSATISQWLQCRLA